MKMIQAKVKEVRGRKRPAIELEDDVNERHGQLLLLLELSEIVDDFPSLLELAIASRKRQQELEANHEDDGNNNNNMESQ